MPGSTNRYTGSAAPGRVHAAVRVLLPHGGPVNPQQNELVAHACVRRQPDCVAKASCCGARCSAFEHQATGHIPFAQFGKRAHHPDALAPFRRIAGVERHFYRARRRTTATTTRAPCAGSRIAVASSAVLARVAAEARRATTRSELGVGARFVAGEVWPARTVDARTFDIRVTVARIAVSGSAVGGTGATPSAGTTAIAETRTSAGNCRVAGAVLTNLLAALAST